MLSSLAHVLPSHQVSRKSMLLFLCDPTNKQTAQNTKDWWRSRSQPPNSLYDLVRKCWWLDANLWSIFHIELRHKWVMRRRIINDSVGALCWITPAPSLLFTRLLSGYSVASSVITVVYGFIMQTGSPLYSCTHLWETAWTTFFMLHLVMCCFTLCCL